MSDCPRLSSLSTPRLPSICRERRSVTGPRVLLLQLSERTSAKGNPYLSGWLGKATVVGFRGDPDKYGNETWNLYVAEPEQREEGPRNGAPSNLRRTN